MRSARGCIRRRGPNRWWVSKPGPPDPVTGKRKEIGVSVRGSELDAMIALANLLDDDMPKDTTWDAFWRNSVEPTFGRLAVKTAHEYRRLWHVELQPVIGEELVRDMSWRRANEVLTSISAPTVQRAAGRLLKKMCNMAIRSGLLTANPVDRAIEYKPHRRKQKALITQEGVRAFLAAVRGSKYEPLILCELGAGLRPEEARALLWADIRPYRLSGNTYAAISVTKALTLVGNTPLFKNTKTSESSRCAVMGEPFASRLLALSEGKDGPLCPSGRQYSEEQPEAWYTSPATIAHNWKQWCERNAIEHVTDANMRSSYATMMGEAMVPDSIVEGNMGHAGQTTKTRHYQSVTMRAKCLAADMLADSIREFE